MTRTHDRDTLATLKDENVRLTNALAFYADLDNWKGAVSSPCAAVMDGGKRAVFALRAKSEDTP